MMHLDTHVVVWLYANQTGSFSPKALELIESEELAISPMVLLEIQYLNEIGRITAVAPLIYEYLSAAIGLQVSSSPFSEVVLEALSEGWTRDPFDRMIVAHAKLDNAMLLTRDQSIHEHCKAAIWS